MADEWYLDASALPDRYWARLRGRDLLTLDGKTHAFATVEEAQAWLREDEYERLEELIDDGELPAGTQPPQAADDAALIPLLKQPRP